jgi:hypothetical protein
MSSLPLKVLASIVVAIFALASPGLCRRLIFTA